METSIQRDETACRYEKSTGLNDENYKCLTTLLTVPVLRTKLKNGRTRVKFQDEVELEERKEND
jgi:hypothetical protein